MLARHVSFYSWRWVDELRKSSGFIKKGSIILSIFPVQIINRYVFAQNFSHSLKPLIAFIIAGTTKENICYFSNKPLLIRACFSPWISLRETEEELTQVTQIAQWKRCDWQIAELNEYIQHWQLWFMWLSCFSRPHCIVDFPSGFLFTGLFSVVLYFFYIWIIKWLASYWKCCAALAKMRHLNYQLLEFDTAE